MKLATRLRSSSLSSVTLARRSAPGFFEEQVVGGDIEDFGEADHNVGLGCDSSAFVAADLSGVVAIGGLSRLVSKVEPGASAGSTALAAYSADLVVRP